MLKNVANIIGRSLLKHNNARTMCPPGRIVPALGAPLPLILVPTLMRSGTHVLIDLILNNFAPYKRRPLYVNLDEVLNSGQAEAIVPRLLDYGTYVIKTHFPQAWTAGNRAPVFDSLTSNAIIVSTTRDTNEICRSTQRFPELYRMFRDDEDLYASLDRFREYWEPFNPLTIPFQSLVRGEGVEEFLHALAERIGIRRNPQLVPPIGKQFRTRVYFAKVLTRLLGHRAPVVNTTIGFAR